MSWAFASPWMLGWAVAGLIPVVLFLLRRRQVEPVTWAAMQFLRVAVAARSRLVNWRDLILLVVRVSIPLLVAICVATPLWRSTVSSLNRVDVTRRHWVLVFDVSASMGYSQHGESVLDLARDRGLEMIDQIASGDRVTILSSGFSQPVTHVRESTNRQEERRVIGALAVTSGIFAIPPMLSMIQTVLDSAEANGVKHHVVFLSDVSGPAWDWVREQTAIERFQRLAEQAVVTVETCGVDMRPNIAVTRLSATPERLTIGQTIRLNVEVAGFELGSPRSTRLVLLDGNRSVAESMIAVPANATTNASFHFQPDRIGDHSLQISVESDALPIDDTRWLTVTVEDAIEMLCVEGLDGAADSLRAATATTAGSPFPNIVTRVVSQSNFNPDIQLMETDVVGLMDPQRCSELQSNGLHRFLLRGGRVLISVGPNTDVGWLNSFMSLIGGEGENDRVQFAAEPQQRDVSFDPLQYAHPAIRAFKNYPQAGLLDVPIWKFLPVRVPAASQQPVMNFTSGDPALFTLPCGNGRVIVSCTPWGTGPVLNGTAERWNAIDAWWSFVPLVNEVIVWGFGDSNPRRNLQVGDELVCDFRESNLRQQYVIHHPDGTTQLTAGDTDGASTAQVIVGETQMPGRYRVQPSGSEVDIKTFSVNVSAGESDVRRRSVDSIRNFLSELDWRPSGDAPAGTPASRRMLLWGLSALLLMLVIEAVLSSWFAWQLRVSPA